jgi:hypothetical protein
MANGDVADAWEQYRAAVGQLLERTWERMRGDVGDSEQAIALALMYSDDLQATLVSGLDEPDAPPLGRELLALQLNQAAAVDLSVAQWLASLEDESPDPADIARADLLVMLNRADAVLTTALGEWPPPILGGAPQAPRDALARSTAGSVGRIHSAAADTAKEVLVKGLFSLALPYVPRAVATPLEDAFDQLAAHAPRLFRRAVQFVLRGVRKLSGVFGAAAQGMRDQVNDWVTDLAAAPSEPVAETWLRKLYDVDGIETRLAAKIHAAPDSTLARMDGAASELDLLAGRFHRQMDVIDTVAGLLRKASSWLIHLAAPWGHIALACGYVGGTGFVVLAGGDYLDWRDTRGKGLLDLVAGVQTIVERATTPPPAQPG